MIAIYWKSGDWQGYTDLLPSWWFEDEGEHPSRQYGIRRPQGGRLLAKCSVSVRGNIADLDYGGDHTAFNERMILIGTMRLIFTDQSRRDVREVQWWRYADKGAGFEVADVEFREPPVPPPPRSPDKNIGDARKRIAGTIVQRQGQPEFRDALLDAYEGRCAVTGCMIEDVLEAAHISPYLGYHTNHVTNGLLLRADIHTLFDRGLIKVDRDYRVTAPAHICDAYELPQTIWVPVNPAIRPNQDALEAKWAGSQ